MSQHDDFDRSIAQWFEAEARPGAPAEVLDRALDATSRRRPRPKLFATLGSHWVGDGAASSGEGMLWRTGVRTSTALVVLLLVLAVVAGAVLVVGRLIPPAPADLGIFAPVAGRIVYEGGLGIWAVDPAAPPDPTTRVKLTSERGVPLGWSSDGTRLLIVRDSRDGARLFVLRADGSETQVTEGLWEILGATLSPDGSRVVFAGRPAAPDGECCAPFALYTIDADGGPAEMLLESQIGILQDPAFSPDGMRIAYADGAGDHSNSVWLVDADGSDAHQILSNEWTTQAGHVYGLAWSAGDRIALGLEGTIYTFATDGSGFKRVITSGKYPYWSPAGARIAYTTTCLENPNGCGLAIADADGSNVLTFRYGHSGPWHPGMLKNGAGPGS